MSMEIVPLVLLGTDRPYPGVHQFQWELALHCPPNTIIRQIGLNISSAVPRGFVEVVVTVQWGARIQTWTTVVPDIAIREPSVAFDELLDQISSEIYQQDRPEQSLPLVNLRARLGPSMPYRISASGPPQSLEVSVTDDQGRSVTDWTYPPYTSWMEIQPSGVDTRSGITDIDGNPLVPLIVPTDKQRAHLQLASLVDALGLPEKVKDQLRDILAEANQPDTPPEPAKPRKIDRSLLTEDNT